MRVCHKAFLISPWFVVELSGTTETGIFLMFGFIHSLIPLIVNECFFVQSPLLNIFMLFDSPLVVV